MHKNSKEYKAQQKKAKEVFEKINNCEKIQHCDVCGVHTWCFRQEVENVIFACKQCVEKIKYCKNCSNKEPVQGEELCFDCYKLAIKKAYFKIFGALFLFLVFGLIIKLAVVLTLD